MPPRASRSSTPKTSYTPTNDPATYRDLLLFEERLKTTAAMLKKRKARYQLFLTTCCLITIIAASDWLLDTYLLLQPLNFALESVKPPYGPFSPIQPPRYLAPGVLLVASTTLFLFFSIGIYSENIGYANKYVSHANRTLRSFNMYLNVRPRPLWSGWFLRLLRSSEATFPPLSPLPPTTPRSPTQRSSSAHRSAPITPIPPPTNPRGELIFNSRVDRGFRESYEKYRAAFEKAREERERQTEETRAATSWRRFDPFRRGWFWNKDGSGSAAATTEAGSATPTRRGRPMRTPSGSRAATPLGSRKASPAGGSSLVSSGSRRRSANVNPDLLLESVPERKPLEGDLRRTPTPLSGGRGHTPPSPVSAGDESDSTTTSVDGAAGSSSRLLRRRERGRTESFSFLLDPSRRHSVLADD